MRPLFTVLFILIVHSTFAQAKIIDSEYEKGNVKDQNEISVSEYYDKPALKTEDDSSHFLFLSSDTGDYVIKINEQWVRSKVDVRPGYMGDFKKISSIIRYPVEARVNNTAGKLYIAFEIDTLGKPGRYEVFNDIGDKCAQAVIDGLKTLPSQWLAAQKDGKTYPSKFILPVTFKMILDGREITPRKSQKSKEFPLARELDEVVILVAGFSR